jgi:hypothetical protein
VNNQRLLGPHLLRPGELISFGDKISLSYEALQFDPNATVVSPVNIPPYQEAYPPAAPYSSPAAGQQQPASAYPPASQPGLSPQQAYVPPASVRPGQAPPAYYSGQIPESPVEYEPPAERKRVSRTWLVLGMGCLLVFLCVCVGAAYAFDALNLYCVPPFGSLFNFLYTCP